MSAASMRLRPARPDEADALGALCMRSKAHWGYDAAFMAACAPFLVVPAEAIARGDVEVAVDASDRPLAFAQLASRRGDAIELDKLFVEPGLIRAGLGILLLRWAMDTARRRGARRLVILADPDAAAFYEKAGARFLHMATSDVVPGRRLPFYEIPLPETHP